MDAVIPLTIPQVQTSMNTGDLVPRSTDTAKRRECLCQDPKLFQCAAPRRAQGGEADAGSIRDHVWLVQESGRSGCRMPAYP